MALITCGHSFLSYDLDINRWEIHTPGLHYSESENGKVLLFGKGKECLFYNQDTDRRHVITSGFNNDDDAQIFCYTVNLLLLSSIFKEN